MAYIEKERVAEVRAELKKLFPGFKFSVTRQHYSMIWIKIVKGPIDFFADEARAEKFDNLLSDYDKKEKHTMVNEFWIEENWAGEAKEMLLKIKEIAGKGNYNRNAGDMGADYPDWNFFLRIQIGDYVKPYEYIS